MRHGMVKGIAVVVLAGSTIALVGSSVACSSTDGCSVAADCGTMGSKPANKSAQLCGVTGHSDGVTASAEGWVWEAAGERCRCEIQLNQLYFKSCAGKATSVTPQPSGPGGGEAVSGGSYSLLPSAQAPSLATPAYGMHRPPLH